MESDTSADVGLFWLLVHRCWSGWKRALLAVTPETVVRWHRAGFSTHEAPSWKAAPKGLPSSITLL
jgi:hypothetical protein